MLIRTNSIDIVLALLTWHILTCQIADRSGSGKEPRKAQLAGSGQLVEETRSLAGHGSRRACSMLDLCTVELNTRE